MRRRRSCTVIDRRATENRKVFMYIWIIPNISTICSDISVSRRIIKSENVLLVNSNSEN